jgi:hypothetical protein
MATQQDFNRAALKVICSYDQIKFLSLRHGVIKTNTSVEIKLNRKYLIDFYTKIRGNGYPQIIVGECFEQNVRQLLPYLPGHEYREYLHVFIKSLFATSNTPITN